MNRDTAKHHEFRIRVRFNEVDAYRIAWHGHYVAWMEEARNELAGRFGVNAAQIAAAGFQAPVVALELKYLRPALFGEELRVRTTMVRSETATLEFLCEILGEDGNPTANGRTVHALTDQHGTIQYRLPQDIAQKLASLFDYLGV